MQRPHNSSRQRPILAGIATLGLLGALFGIAVPAFATHGEGLLTTSLGSHPNPCPAGSTAYKLDQFPADDDTHTYTSDDGLFSVDITVTARESDSAAQPTAISFANASPAVVRVTSKAGSVESTDPYESTDFPGGATSGSIGPRGDEKAISFLAFCVGSDTTGGGTSTPTEVATTTPTEFPTTTPTEGPTGTPGGTGGELGGQSGGGGNIPNTASQPLSLGQIVTALSVLLVIGSVGALVVPSLARRTNR